MLRMVAMTAALCAGLQHLLHVTEAYVVTFLIIESKMQACWPNAYGFRVLLVNMWAHMEIHVNNDDVM